MPAMKALGERVTAAGFRLQARLTTVRSSGVTAYIRRSDSSFRQYTGRELGHEANMTSVPSQSLFEEGVGSPEEENVVRDVLVCTHGRRDACCGSLGTKLFQELQASELPTDVCLARTSHTGGHRFAPTLIVLPEGTAWAFADVNLVRRILYRVGDVGAVVDRYRGCTGLSSRRVQVLEREVFRRVGWTLLDSFREGREESNGVVTLAVSMNGQTSVWEAIVEPGRTVAIPECGQPLAAKRTETEWVVRSLALQTTYRHSPTD